MFRCLLALVALFAVSGSLACDKPQKINVPDGHAATARDMVALQGAMRDYVAAMGVYLDCIVAEEQQRQRAADTLSPQAEQQRQDLLSAKYNAAIDEMEAVVLSHNREARKFRERGNR